MSDHAWPTARLELVHTTRGRVTDIGTAPGAFDAAFVAAGHILGISPALVSFNVQSDRRDNEGALIITVTIELELDGLLYTGTARGQDLVEGALRAWLDAAGRAVAAGNG